MNLPNLTFNDLQLQAAAGVANEAFVMDQDTFAEIYERTSRPIWVFLWRKTNDSQLADDLLQETYYRFLKTRVAYESDAHRRNYLFRIAANLANDTYRSRVTAPHVSLSEDSREDTIPTKEDVAESSQKRKDLDRAMAQLPARQRDALWLAYVEGSSHEEIAGILGLKVGSIKLLLFRARKKMVKLLGGAR